MIEKVEKICCNDSVVVVVVAVVVVMKYVGYEVQSPVYFFGFFDACPRMLGGSQE